jgi:hypothetical protein
VLVRAGGWRFAMRARRRSRVCKQGQHENQWSGNCDSGLWCADRSTGGKRENGWFPGANEKTRKSRCSKSTPGSRKRPKHTSDPPRKNSRKNKRALRTKRTRTMRITDNVHQERHMQNFSNRPTVMMVELWSLDGASWSCRSIGRQVRSPV